MSPYSKINSLFQNLPFAAAHNKTLTENNIFIFDLSENTPLVKEGRNDRIKN